MGTPHAAAGLAPDQFIDVAEESGLINPIGEWVMATAFTAAKRWRDCTPGVPPYVAVNVSVRQFAPGNFVGTFRRLLAESGLLASQVVLEITESLLLRDDDQIWHDLQQLRTMGTRIAVDDFGTGYSALSYLRQVPLDLVKLDRTFVTPMTGSVRQREVVRGIVRLATTLDLQVIAEGIETSAERATASEVDCAYGQGFFFSPPMPYGRTEPWIRDHIPPTDVGPATTAAAPANRPSP